MIDGIGNPPFDGAGATDGGMALRKSKFIRCVRDCRSLEAPQRPI